MLYQLSYARVRPMVAAAVWGEVGAAPGQAGAGAPSYTSMNRR